MKMQEKGLQFVGWKPNYFSPVKDLFQVIQKRMELYFRSALGTEYQFSKTSEENQGMGKTQPWTKALDKQRHETGRILRRRPRPRSSALPEVKDSSVQIPKEAKDHSGCLLQRGRLKTP